MKNPDFSQIREVLKALNGAAYDEMILEVDCRNELYISGGESGFYNICLGIDGEFFGIWNDKNPNVMFWIQLGGQSVEITKQSCVDLEMAEDLCRDFDNKGGRVLEFHQYEWIESS